MASEFVKVRHPELGEAEITPAELPEYASLGYEPDDRAAAAAAKRAGTAANATAQPLAAASGTDQRLDLVLDELRGLRSDIAKAFAPTALEPIEGETVELRGIGAPTTTPAPTPTTTTTKAPKP